MKKSLLKADKEIASLHMTYIKEIMKKEDNSILLLKNEEKEDAESKESKEEDNQKVGELSLCIILANAACILLYLHSLYYLTFLLFSSLP